MMRRRREDPCPVFARRRCRIEHASGHSERRSSSPLAPPPAKQVPGGFSMLTATCMQPGKSTSVVMVVQGLLSAQFSPAAAAAPSPPLATASAVAQAHWRRRPQNKSRAASTCLRQHACNRARAQQSLWWFKGLLSARRRCHTEPASSHSERRSSSPLAPLPAKQVFFVNRHWQLHRCSHGT